MTDKDNGASADADRATAVEPAPVSPLRDGIPSAIKRALSPLKNWSESRMSGSHAEKIIWEDYYRAAPAEVVKALQDAGFAIVPVGGRVPVTVTIDDGKKWEMRASVRAQMQMRPLIVYAEKTVPSHYLTDPEFRRNHLPRILARTILAQFENQTGEQIAQAIEAGTAKTEGLGPKDESAVATPCAPRGESNGQ